MRKLFIKRVEIKPEERGDDILVETPHFKVWCSNMDKRKALEQLMAANPDVDYSHIDNRLKAIEIMCIRCPNLIDVYEAGDITFHDAMSVIYNKNLTRILRALFRRHRKLAEELFPQYADIMAIDMELSGLPEDWGEIKGNKDVAEAEEESL